MFLTFHHPVSIAPRRKTYVVAAKKAAQGGDAAGGPALPVSVRPDGAGAQ
jgi:hypothetical protein